MSQAQVNGDVPPTQINSVFLEHLLTYPFIKDGVSTIRDNQLGQKSLRIGDTAYRRLAGPVLPYLAGPYQFVSPYLERADALGAQTLTRVDERFPAIKKPTGELYADARSLVLLPYHKGLEGKEHLLNVYSEECRRLGKDQQQQQQGLVTYSKALVGTAFAIGGETYQLVNDFIASRRTEMKDAVNEKANN